MTSNMIMNIQTNNRANKSIKNKYLNVLALNLKEKNDFTTLRRIFQQATEKKNINLCRLCINKNKFSGNFLLIAR